MIHDAFFWAFLVESAGYIVICAIIARVVWMLPRSKPTSAKPTPAAPGSLRERMRKTVD